MLYSLVLEGLYRFFYSWCCAWVRSIDEFSQAVSSVTHHSTLQCRKSSAAYWILSALLRPEDLLRGCDTLQQALPDRTKPRQRLLLLADFYFIFLEKYNVKILGLFLIEVFLISQVDCKCFTWLCQAFFKYIFQTNTNLIHFFHWDI